MKSRILQLLKLENQMKDLRTSTESFYTSSDYADAELDSFISYMANNISEFECVQALVTLETFAERNNIKLSDLTVGSVLDSSESITIEATYIDDFYSDNSKYYDELTIVVDTSGKVDGIYYSHTMIS